ncbi:hypothetical protein [Halocatena halophila]|uniref:hypothetical protein n=1 Tax=Halocatena halophila TaxID=2814576 RepID=UPI002ED699AF
MASTILGAGLWDEDEQIMDMCKDCKDAPAEGDMRLEKDGGLVILRLCEDCMRKFTDNIDDIAIDGNRPLS